jgi:hypothetical protein
MDKLPTSFGLTIAFFFPGLLALVAISYFLPEVRVWLSGTSAGGALLATIASAGAGACVSHVRSLIDEVMKRFQKPRPDLNHEARAEAGKELAYQALLTNHYHFYLFGTNTTVAGWLVCFAWWWVGRPTWASFGGALFAGAVASVILWVTAGQALQKFYDKALQLLGPKPQEQ